MAERPHLELRPLVLAACAVALYLATAPGIVNADGLGYLKLLPHDFAAGHLLYMPLLRFATAHLGGDALKIGRLVDALLGGTGVLLVYGIAYRIAPLRADRRYVGTVAACGTALSYGWWAECADVEAYALALVALLALARVALAYGKRPGLGRAAVMGVLLGTCVCCHLTHVLLSLFVVVICLDDPRGRRAGLASAVLALAIGGSLALGLYAYATLIVRGHHLEGALRWVLTAQHGYTEHNGVYALAAAVYGLARTFVWSPYLYEADAPRLIGQLLLGLTLLVFVAASIRARRGAVAELPWRALGALTVPYAALGVLFFGADPERWVFVLPFVWIVLAVALDAGSARHTTAALAIAYVGALNLFLAVLPAHRDGWARHQAELAAQPLANGDLVIFPGHSWDEYVGFYGGRTVEPFPVSYYAARDGQAALWSRLDREVGAARARGHAVYALRLFDESREVSDDPAGYAELRAIGMSRGALRAGLEARFHVVPVLDRDGVTVVRLDPPSAP